MKTMQGFELHDTGEVTTQQEKQPTDGWWWGLIASLIATVLGCILLTWLKFWEFL